MPGSKKVFGRSPSPARVNRLKRLLFPLGTSGSNASQSCSSSKSATEIRPSRKRNARWSTIGPGGGLLVFGIPVLLVEYDPLQLVREAADFVVVFGVFQALQANMEGLFGGTAGVGRRGSAGVTRAAISALGRPCGCRFPGVLTALFGREPGRTGWAGLLAALARQANSSGILLFCGHTSIVREGQRSYVGEFSLGSKDRSE